MHDVVILSAVRTPIGDFGGALRELSASALGVIVARAALERAGVEPGQVQDVLLGNCMMRTDEINVARCVALQAGVPHSTPAATIQRQCASGMQALVFAVQQIQTGEHECVLAGGVESMSRIPYVSYAARWGQRMGHTKLVDALTEGLSDPLGHFHMGLTAENLAAEFSLSRADQDEQALRSHQRAVAATEAGSFADEIVPVPTPAKGAPDRQLTRDEHPRADVSLAGLAKLKPAFKPEGTVTAGNSSSLNDGAAALLVASRAFAERHGRRPLAVVRGHRAAGVEPERMGIGPVPAVRALLAEHGLRPDRLDLIELNEAFAAQYLACERALDLDPARTNIYGSGIGLGHPVGATGARLLVTLAHALRRTGGKLGLATLCVGGGMGKAVLIEAA